MACRAGGVSSVDNLYAEFGIGWDKEAVSDIDLILDYFTVG
jgi:hypothetical protein